MSKLAVIVTTTLTLASSVMLYASLQISIWERENNYPYGQMCNSVFTLYTDTCPHRVQP